MVNNFSKKKKILLAIFIFLSVIFAISVSLFCYQKAYASKIYKNVFYGDQNLSGKTKTQVRNILENQIHSELQSELTIKNSDGSKEAKYQLGQTGGYVDIDQTINELYSVGRDKNFFKQIYFSAKTVVS